MTSLQIKAEINKLLDQFPDYSLKYILNILKEIQSQSLDNISLTNNLKKILSEDKELLQKLAK